MLGRLGSLEDLKKGLVLRLADPEAVVTLRFQRGGATFVDPIDFVSVESTSMQPSTDAPCECDDASRAGNGSAAEIPLEHVGLEQLARRAVEGDSPA